MIRYRMTYPGDPPSQVIEMTRAEFQADFRPSHWTLSDPSGDNVTTFPVGMEDIQCDGCNVDPGDTIFVWLYGRGGCKGYCQDCFNELFKEHCTQLTKE
jgi:hypothetical protein